MSLFCMGFHFFKYHIRQILQLGDTFYFFTFFFAIDWSYEERERREERKEEDG